jgi:group I intron endonuclease
MPYANRISGIYIITCNVNNKHYIGKSVHCQHRINQHKRALKEDKHHSYHLQRAYNKYGMDKFIYNILEEYPDEFLFSMEKYWIYLLNSTDRKFGYNIAIPNGMGGFTTDSDTRIKMRDSKLGTKLSEVTKEKLRKININNKLTEDQLKNLQLAGIKYRTTQKFIDDTLIKKLIRGKKIVIYNYKINTWKNFDTLLDAAIDLKTTTGAISSVKDKPSKSIKGHLVFSENNFNSNIIYTKQKRKNGRTKNKIRLEEI